MSKDPIVEPEFIDEPEEQVASKFRVVDGFAYFGDVYIVPIDAIVCVGKISSTKLRVTTTGGSVSFVFSSEEDSQAFIDRYVYEYSKLRKGSKK